MKSCPHPFHANEIISPMSHLHVSRKAPPPPPFSFLKGLPTLPPPLRLALGPGQFGHHRCLIICLCLNQDAAACRHPALVTYQAAP